MIYVWEISTPANTSFSSRQKTILELEPGIIRRVWLRFPPGPGGLLHVRFFYETHPLWPRLPEEDFSTDDEVIEFEENIPLIQPPYRLICETWNEDTVYDHSIIVRILLEEIQGLTRPLTETLEETAEGGLV